MHFRQLLFVIAFTASVLCPHRMNAQVHKNQGNSRQFQLAPPRATETQTIFTLNTSQALDFGLEGAEIHYTLDGSDPTPASPRYSGPVPVSATCVLKARSFHMDYLPSEPLTVHFFRAAGIPAISRVSLKPDPNPAYPGRHAAGLVDRVKGTGNFKSQEWSGFSGDDVEVQVSFTSEASIKKITISLLADPGAWIFPPEKVTVSALNTGHEPQMLASKKLDPPGSDMKGGFRYITLEGPFNGRQFQVSIRQMDQIPDWHQGKGTAPWLFIDEIIFE